MSAALVHQALQIVDPTFTQHKKTKKSKQSKEVFTLMPQSHKITKQVTRKGRTEKVSLLATSKKLTITEAKQNLKTPQQILKENLKKLKKIRQASTIELDKDKTKQIIQRAVTRRPVKSKKVAKKKSQKTAFTEEDFKKFEAEYFG